MLQQPIIRDFSQDQMLASIMQIYRAEMPMKKILHQLDNSGITTIPVTAGSSADEVFGDLDRNLPESDWLSIRIRQNGNINESLSQALFNRLPRVGSEEQSTEVRVNQIAMWYGRPVYLIFEELEDLFITADEQEIAQFIGTILALKQAGVCRIALVISRYYQQKLQYSMQRYRAAA